MQLTTLDIITRRALLENSLPIHYYPELLFHSATALRELSFDTLQIVNAAQLSIDSTGNANLPSDFVDDLACCIAFGGKLSHIPKNYDLTPIRVHNTTTGAFENLTTPLPSSEINDNTFFGFPGVWSYYWNVNDYSEPTGRFFGAAGGTAQGYQVFKAQRRIQFTGNFDTSGMTLLYISDGQSVNNASQIDVQAFQAIRAFQEWKRSSNANNEHSPEGQHWHNQRRLLRARMDDLTIVDFKNIMRNAYRASIKN